MTSRPLLYFAALVSLGLGRPAHAQNCAMPEGLFHQVSAGHDGWPPIFILPHDFDGNAAMDAVVVTAYGVNPASVTLMRGGPGGLSVVHDVSTQVSPKAVVIGDLNDDGNPDIVTANEERFGNETLSVLLGSGGFVFGPDDYYLIPARARQLTLLDVNGDGWKDVLFADRLSAAVGVGFGNGSGQLDSIVLYPTPNFVVGFAAGPPGALQIRTANFSQDGQNAFSLLQWSAAGLEVVESHSGPALIVLARNADLNGDSIEDWLVAAGAPSSFLISMLGGPAGEYAARDSVSPAFQVVDVQLGDVDGDTVPDPFVVSRIQNSPRNRLEVFRGSSDGDLAPFGALAGVGGGPLAIADFDGDGVADLVVGNPTGLSFMSGGGLGVLPGLLTMAAPRAVGPIAAADCDRNGYPDFIVPVDPDSVVVFLNGPSGAVGRVAHHVGVSPSAVDAGDVDGDGWIDIVVANRSAHSLSILFGPDGHDVRTVSFTGGPVDLACADVNHDDVSDVLVVAGGLRMIAGRGDRNLVAGGSVLDGATTVALSDMDADGHVDVVASVYTGADGVAVLRGDGSGGFAPWFSREVAIPVGDVEAGDVDGDGRNDVVYGGLGGLWAIRRELDGGFRTDEMITDGVVPAVALGDVNGDARTDVVVPGDDFGTISVFGWDGSAWVDRAVGTGATVADAVVVDANGDSCLDVVAVSTIEGVLIEVGAERDGPTSTLLDFLGTERRGDGVVLHWRVGAVLDRVELQRSRADEGVWSSLGSCSPDGRGQLDCVDAAVTPGTWWYRLRFSTAGIEHVSAPVRVAVQGAHHQGFQVGRLWQAGNRLNVELASSSGAPVVLDLFDVGGRRMLRRMLSPEPAGRVEEVFVGDLRSGFYLVTLRQSGQVVTRKTWLSW